MYMQILGTITSQGQLTIPADIRIRLGLSTPTKVEMEVVNEGLLVRPKSNFWSLGGVLKSKVSLSEKELRQARGAFASDLSKHGRRTA